MACQVGFLFDCLYYCAASAHFEDNPPLHRDAIRVYIHVLIQFMALFFEQGGIDSLMLWKFLGTLL